MFWVARDLSSSKMGLITILPLQTKKLTALKNNGLAKSGNAGGNASMALIIKEILA